MDNYLIYGLKNPITQEIGIWANCAECARDLKLSSTSVQRCIKGLYKQCKGYTFKEIV